MTVTRSRSTARTRGPAVAVAVLAAVLGVAPAAGAAPGADAPSGTDSGAATVEWVVAADDTFADAVRAAVRSHDAATVARHLEGLAAVAASGSVVNFPGLDALAPAEAARVAASTAAAVAQGAAAPRAAEELALDAGSAVPPEDEPPFPWDPDQTDGRVLVGGLAYEQVNWLRRGESTPDGEVRWTDEVKLRWVTQPGPTSSWIGYWLTHPKRETGYFGASRVRTWAFTGETQIGVTPETAISRGRAVVRHVRNTTPTFGQTIWHGTVLTTATSEGWEGSSSYRTIEASCRTAPFRSCTYR